MVVVLNLPLYVHLGLQNLEVIHDGVGLGRKIKVGDALAPYTFANGHECPAP